eukprot:gene1580-biopygen2957
MQQCCRRLQQQICAQLAHQVGVNSLYAQALERFGTQRLQDGWRMLTSQLELKQSSMEQQQQAQQQPQEHLRPIAQQTAANIPQHADMPPSPPALQSQLQRQQQQPPQQQQQQRQQQRPHQQPCLHGDSPSTRLTLRLQQPADIACLSLQLPQALHSLHLTVPYQTFGPAAAATSAAVAVFLSSLQRHQHLQQLHLAFHSSDYGAVLCQGGTGLSRLPELWRHSVRALTAAMQVRQHCVGDLHYLWHHLCHLALSRLSRGPVGPLGTVSSGHWSRATSACRATQLEAVAWLQGGGGGGGGGGGVSPGGVNCGLSELVLVAYPGQLPAEELAALQEVMAAARRRLRLAVLMGTHPRLGADSPILRLPHEVMRMLLNAAVPAIGCVLQLQLPLDLGAQHGLPGAFSSTDGSDSSDTDDSSSADDSESD